MIEQLTGALVEVLPSFVVLDVHGVGFGLGVSATTASQLPAAGEAGVTLLTRLLVREDAMDLYGFSSREERAVFDRLVAISGVGPKLALAVLSTFSPQTLAGVIALQDDVRLAQVPGIGKKKAQRLLVELQDVFAKDAALRGLVGQPELPGTSAGAAAPAAEPIEAEATAALLSMGFTPQETELALKGMDEAGVTTIEKAISYALHRLGGGA